MSRYLLRLNERFFETMDYRGTHIYMHAIASFAASEFLKHDISQVIRDCVLEERSETVRQALSQIAGFYESHLQVSPDLGGEWHEEAYAFYDQAIDTFLKTAGFIQEVDYDSPWARVLRGVADQITPYRNAIFREITIERNRESVEFGGPREIPISKNSIFNAHAIIPAAAVDMDLIEAALFRKIGFARSEEKREIYKGVREELLEYTATNMWRANIGNAYRHTDKTLQQKITEARGLFNFATDNIERTDNNRLCSVIDCMDSWLGDLTETDAELVNLGEPNEKTVISVDFRRGKEKGLRQPHQN